MNKIYFLYKIYQSGRISIRDRPYSTLSAARQARSGVIKRLPVDSVVKSIGIGYQIGLSDLSDIDIKKII